MIRVDKEKAYLLHSKPYRENSLLASFLTKNHGKISFIINTAKTGRAKKKSNPIIFQHCYPVFLSYRINNNLCKIEKIELIETKNIPSISYFMHYQYAHEILLKILRNQDPTFSVFKTYELFLKLLINEKPLLALRLLEIAIIDHFNGLSNIYHHHYLRDKVDTKKHYTINKDWGISDIKDNGTNISGEQLNSFNFLIIIYHKHLDFHEKEEIYNIEKSIAETVAKASQTITSFFIKKLLGNKKLQSKNIYRELQNMDLI